MGNKGKRPAEAGVAAGAAASEMPSPAKKARAKAADDQEVPTEWRAAGDGVEVTIDEKDLPEAAPELFLLASELAEDPETGDDAAVSQKLLETAVDRFRAAQAKGCVSPSYLYYFGQCLVTLASQVLVADLVTEALDILTKAVDAIGAAAGKKPSAELGAAPPASKSDVLAALAQAYVEKARVDFVLTADELDDDEANAKLLGTLAEATAHHTAALGATDGAAEQLERLLAFSRALLHLAQGALDDVAESQSAVIEMAIGVAKEGLALDPKARAALAQQAACLVAQAKCDGAQDGDAEVPLLEQAVVALKSSLGSDDSDEEADVLQMLAQAQIQLGQIHPDDDKAETLFGEGVECYKKAATLQPHNRKLKQLVLMIEKGTA